MQGKLSGYLDELKVEISFFQTFRVINLQGGLIIRPLKINQIDLEAKVYYLNSHYDDIKKYLTHAYPQTEEHASQILANFLYGTSMYRQFLFAICREKENFPIGYILCSSPWVTFPNNQKIGDWSLDFWLNPDYKNHGIMTHALANLFDYLIEFQIPQLFVFTDKTNLASIKVLQKLGFKQTDELADENYLSFRLKF